MKLKTKFQDEDFELGEVVDAIISTTSLVDTHIKLKAKSKRGGEHMFSFSRISELFELFEDYEEPKVYYYISDFGVICEREIGQFPGDEEDRKRIGNYFETREEAEKAVEKLKARTRLINHGLCLKLNKFQDRIEYKFKTGCISSAYDAEEALKDLDLLFGGKES